MEEAQLVEFEIEEYLGHAKQRRVLFESLANIGTRDEV